MKHFLAIFLPITLLAQPLLAQQEPVIRITVNLVQIDAVVTDSKGRHITDLTADDFEILQDGKPQKIAGFNYVSLVNPSPTAPKPVAAIKGKDAAPILPNAQSKLTLGNVKRTVAFVIDDLGLSFESVAFVRSALKKFVEQQMQPGDLVAVVRTSKGMGALQGFTSDKRILLTAVDKLRWNFMSRVGISSFAPISTDGDSAADQLRNEVFTVGTLGALSNVVQGLREVPGRKSVIVVSENIRVFSADGSNSRATEAIERLTDLANRSAVVIYTLDPRGLPTLSLTAADNVSGREPHEVAQIPAQRAQEYFESQNGLDYIARQTGGKFIRDTNDLAGGIKEVMEDAAGYYLVGYIPAEETFNKNYHKIKLRVKKAGYSVRYRNGFFGVPDTAPPPLPTDKTDQLKRALFSPFGTSGINLKMTSLLGANDKTEPFVHTLLYIDCSNLRFTKQENVELPPLPVPAPPPAAAAAAKPPAETPAKPSVTASAITSAITADAPAPKRFGTLFTDTLDVMVVNVGEEGNIIDSSYKTYTIKLEENQYNNIRKTGLIYTVQHPIKKPGAYQIRVAVRDGGSGLAGSANQFMEIPNLAKKRLMMSGLFMSARDGAIGSNSAVRIFHPGQQVIYAFQVLNAKTEGEKDAQLTSQVRLFRDGEKFYEGKLLDLKLGQIGPAARHYTGGQLSLGAKLAPGEYVMQVLVTDKLAKEKEATAMQAIDFEVK
jgi:VWFA-related protein